MLSRKMGNCTNSLPVKHLITIQDGGIENLIYQAFRAKIITPALQANEVLDHAKSTDVEIILVRNRLRWLGHVARMPDVRPVKALLYGALEEGSRRVGCPLLRYKDTLKDHPQAWSCSRNMERNSN